MENKRVLLGMSGGVDSSVSALLLKKQGYEVIGITLEMFEGNSNVSLDAKKVCEKLHIPHYSFSCKEDFKEHVIDDFITCYSNCKTPNPCIECNKYIKFGYMYEKAKELGCKYVATGHYAKNEYNEQYNRWVIKKSNAGNKDQTYVLWNIPKEVIEHIIFPLSDFENKDQIREIARDAGLEVANKPDSEDICFIPNGNYKEFLEINSSIKPKAGNIVNSNGEILGRHTGLYNYTIGQRKGLGIAYKVPLFVLGFNKTKNEVIVGEEKELYKKEILVNNINLLLIDNLDSPIVVDVKTRYSTKSAKATIIMDNKDLKEAENVQVNEEIYEKGNNKYIRSGNIKVVFQEPQRAITPGQSAVFYINDMILGGGKIVK